MAEKEKPQYGGTHFLGTGTYYPLNEAAAEELYNELPKFSKSEWQTIQAGGGESRRKEKRGG